MKETTILWAILLQVVLICFNAVFACTEIAVISIHDAKMAKMAETGDKRAKRLLMLTNQPAKFLATIQVAITLSGFLGSAFAADNFSDLLVGALVGMGVTIPVKTLDTLAVIGITLILSYFTLVFGELVPKRIAMKKAESIALFVSSAIMVISKIFAPIVWLLTASTNGILRLCGMDPNEEAEEVTEEEIRMMVDVGSEKGTIDYEEKELIQNVFEFDDLTVEEICTHRTETTLLWMDEPIEKWEKLIHETRHSKYPVCGESVEDVAGILLAKDFFRLRSHDKERILREAVVPAYFVPESLKADVLFKNMKKTGRYFAVVLDEYGGMSGIITMKDLVEQLVGEFDEDMSEQEEEVIFQKDETTWVIRGSAPLEEVEEKLGIALPSEEYDTFGGFVFGERGYVPDDGSRFEIHTNGLSIQADLIKDHRLERAYVRLCDTAG